MFTGLLRDVSERKKAELQIRLLSRAIEQCPASIVITDTEGSIEYVNPKFSEVTGYTLEEVREGILGFSNRGRCRPRDTGSSGRPSRAGSNGGGSSITRRRTGNSTGNRPRSPRSSTIRGVITQFVAVKEDIGEQKRSKDLLELRSADLARLNEVVRRSEERYQALAIASSQIIWTTGPEGDVVNMSMWRAFSGQSEEEVKGWEWVNALHPEDRERTVKVWSEAVGIGSVYETEYRIRRSDGEYREHLEVRGVPVLQSGGGVREWIRTCNDITERKRAEEELRRARDEAMDAARAKGDFLAAMSHEIRTPMNGVVGATGLLLATDGLSPEQRDLVKTVRDSGNALLTVINDILDFSKIEAGRLDLERSPFGLRRLAEEAVDLVAPAAFAKGLELVASVPPDLHGWFELEFCKERFRARKQAKSAHFDLDPLWRNWSTSAFDQV